MDTYELVVPCHFGLEAVTKREIYDLGYEITRDYKFLNDKSFSISRNGYIKDFGTTGFAGDIFDFIMQEKNIPLPKAIKFVADCLGVKYE